ncbi:Hypothetical predicted protein, partial [Paramuricea clavata]
YAKAHPSDSNYDSQFETPYDRDLRLIYEGQNAVHQIVNNLHMKTGDLTTQINELQRIMSVENLGGGGKDSISRQEVNSIINLQNQLTSGMEEVKNIVRGLSGGVVKRDVGDDSGGNTASEISSLRNSMEIMMENVNHLVTKQQFASKEHGKDNDKGCPPVEKPNCIGPGYFVFLTVVQIVALVAYFTYKSHKEAAAKKFF